MEFPEKKPRRKHGIKNKALSMQKLVNAVGEIIRTQGYTGLGVNNIAKQAGVDKVLIYRYFTSPEKLIETYVLEKDYWLVFSEKLRNQEAEEKGDLQEILTSILEKQFDYFYQEEEMQQLILWEIAGKSELMKNIALIRESMAVDLLKQTDQHFKGSRIDFRVLSALLSAGIYYMVLHKDMGEYCGIDINEPDQRLKLKDTVREMVALVFEERDRKK